jgi:hypothetical protein
MPHVPTDLLDRIRALEREVALLRGRAQIRPALDQIHSGPVSIGEGGSLNVFSPNLPTEGPAIFSVGAWGDGTYGLAVRRDDGSSALLVGGEVGGTDEMVRVFSRSGQPIVMDDAYADGYLGLPYVPIPVATGVDVTSDTERTTHQAMVVVQHRVIQAYTNVYAPPNTTIVVRYRLNGPSGYEDIGQPITVSGGASGQEAANTQRIPINRPHSDRWRLLIRAARTAGTGTGVVYPFGLWGVHTTDPSEA